MTATARPLTLLETLASIHLLSRKWLDYQLPSLAFLALAARRCLPLQTVEQIPRHCDS